MNKVQERELERKYQYVTHNGANAYVAAPQPDKYSEVFKNLGRTRYVAHSRLTESVANTLLTINSLIDCPHHKEKVFPRELLEEPSDLLAQMGNETRVEAGDIDTEPSTPPAKKPCKIATSRKTTAGRKAVPEPRAVRGRKPERGQGRYRRSNSAMEGDSSSPEPTPADMRIATQGIDLGSDDTSGDDAPEAEPSSQLADFVVGSDQPIEFASSSFHNIDRSIKKRPNRAKAQQVYVGSDDELPDDAAFVGRTFARGVFAEEVDGESDSDNVRVRKRKRRPVIDDDSDD